jgi:hypothetical protein
VLSNSAPFTFQGSNKSYKNIETDAISKKMKAKSELLHAPSLVKKGAQTMRK